MIKTSLIGSPVGHSVAPILHTKIAEACGLGPNDFAYVKTEVEPGRVGEALNAFECLGFSGGNVTLPIKLEVMDHVEPDESARFIGAVNTFVLRDGKRYGYNTDWQGVKGALERAGLAKENRDAFVVLGSGGAARAAIYAARELGFKKTTVFYEEPIDEKTRNLLGRADEFGAEIFPYDPRLEVALAEATVIYNTTSTGMEGFSDAPFDLTRLTAIDMTGKIAADAVFNPVETSFLRAAKNRGANVVDGVWWTIFQGEPSFALWTNRQPHLGLDTLTAIHSLMVATIEKH